MEGNFTTNKETKECRPTQIETDTNSNEKKNITQQKNKKSRSVIIQIPEDHRNNNKEPRIVNTLSPKKPSSESTPHNPIITISDIHELRSEDKDSTPQRMTSVCWNTNSSTTSNTLDFLWTPSAQQACRLFV
mmetsp:Transcript_62462/g.69864  ORF Transcript_62462/g.69864 Transcript_62462/m.69864 type:complete len:132 (+) Transcript_62462:13-408(+)